MNQQQKQRLTALIEALHANEDELSLEEKQLLETLQTVKQLQHETAIDRYLRAMYGRQA